MAKKRSTGFGARLKELREQAGLTQAALAEKAGLHLMGLVKVEHGSREPAWATVLALAEALQIDVGEFVIGTETVGSAPRPRGRPAKPSPASQEQQPPTKPADATLAGKKGGKGPGRKRKNK